MWQASIFQPDPARSVDLAALAHRALAGVGDPQAGEWLEQNLQFVSLFRRLTPAEAKKVGPIRDIRDHFESFQRRDLVQRAIGMELPIV